MRDYPWSSLAGGYALSPGDAPRVAAGDGWRGWLCGYNAAGRRRIAESLDRPARWRRREAGRHSACGRRKWTPRESSAEGLVLGQPAIRPTGAAAGRRSAAQEEASQRSRDCGEQRRTARRKQEGSCRRDCGSRVEAGGSFPAQRKRPEKSGHCAGDLAEYVGADELDRGKAGDEECLQRQPATAPAGHSGSNPNLAQSFDPMGKQS